MKKVTKIIAGLVLAASVAVTAGAMAGCASEETYKGEYSYESTWTKGQYYGVKVDVVVKGNKIVSVTCEADPENWHNISPNWEENMNPGDLGHEKAAAGLNDYLKKFEGKTVDEVLALKVVTTESGEPDTETEGETSQGSLIYTGATQTSGRIILAVQNALEKIEG